MNLLSTLILLASVVLTLGCPDVPVGPNIARNGVASQISNFLGDASSAIDGISDTHFSRGSCTHTNQEKDPWWRLDLKQRYKITNVVITNRMDCCPERLMWAEVRVGDSPDNNNPVCYQVGHVTAAHSFCCEPMKGRYISVVIPGRSEYLTLCEVEVYGELIIEEKKPCW